jgi:hypothetical protein|nr:MAG TPA: Protein of unknown function (DUF2442) [Caudoviricetes sp.]
MIIRIREVKPLDNFILLVTFDDGKIVEYDMKEDIRELPEYCDLQTIPKLWEHVRLDSSRTCVYWNDYIDLPSDIIYEYGKEKVGV